MKEVVSLFNHGKNDQTSCKVTIVTEHLLVKMTNLVVELEKLVSRSSRIYSRAWQYLGLGIWWMSEMEANELSLPLWNAVPWVYDFLVTQVLLEMGFGAFLFASGQTKEFIMSLFVCHIDPFENSTWLWTPSSQMAIRMYAQIMHIIPEDSHAQTLD